MKKISRAFFVITFISSILITGCKKKELPSLTTSPLADITMTSAKTGGDITDDGNAGIIQRGVSWSTSPEPTTGDNSTSDGSGAGIFESTITGLEDGVTYYVRAYATNSEGTSYGNEISFNTVAAGKATITTRAVTNLSFTTARCGGDISSDGGGQVTDKGICWGTSENPTIANNVITSGTGNDGFTSDLTGLLEGTTYYIRAYATNKAGTSYGNQISFTTPRVKAPTLSTSVATSVTTTSASSGGSVSDGGGGNITQRGVCWSTTPGPNIENNKTSDGSGLGEFISNITGLIPGTVYYLRSYATNSAGTSYGNEIKFSTSITDVDGNTYKTALIGNQLWMAENLKTTTLNDNTPIPLVKDSLSWISLTTPAYTWYRDNSTWKDQMGGLYNWFTAATGKVCPQGWHVPTQLEFQTMEKAIGITADSVMRWGWRGPEIGTHLKSSTGWTNGNGDNSTGFNAVPSGYRAWLNGQYRAIHIMAFFWTATDDAINNKPTVAWYRRLDANSTRVYNATTEKQSGKSIRCIKN